MSSTPEIRRLAMQKVVGRMTAAGHVLDTDPRYLAWIEAWITGDLSMNDVRLLYGSLFDERREMRRTERQYSKAAFAALFDELDVPLARTDWNLEVAAA